MPARGVDTTGETLDCRCGGFGEAIVMAKDGFVFAPEYVSVFNKSVGPENDSAVSHIPILGFGHLDRRGGQGEGISRNKQHLVEFGKL